MNQSNPLDPMLLAETPIARNPVPPGETPRRPSDLKKALARVVDRCRMWFAKLPPLMKSHPRIAWGAGVGLVVVVAFAVWHPHGSRTTAPAHPRVAEVEKLENLARDAYKRGHYVLPIETSALAYSKRALKLAPWNNYSRTMLENSIHGGKYQVQQALKRKDFAQAHQVADAMAQLLPARKDIAELKQDIRNAERGPSARTERASTAARPAEKGKKHPAAERGARARTEKASTAARPAEKGGKHPKAAPTISFAAYHLHSNKAPADHGPYCLGIMSVRGQHLRFSGQSASRGQKVHKFDFASSDVREIKKNARLASRQGGFHVRTASGTINFVPRDSSRAHVAAVASAFSN